MTDPSKYSRVAFLPTDQSYSAVRLLDPADETRIIGTISKAVLHARAVAKEKMAAEQVAPRVDWFTPTAPRRRQAALSLTRRNRARRKDID